MPNYFIRVRRRLPALAAAFFALLLPGANRFSTPLAQRIDNAQPDSASSIEAVERFHAAVALGDTATVLTLLASDVVIIESGEVESLGDYRSHHLAGDVQFSKAVPGSRSPMRAAVQGGVAWVSSTTAMKGTFNGRLIDSIGAELMVLTRTGTAWKIRAIHWSSHSRLPR